MKIYDPTDPSTNPYNAGRVFADGAKLLVPSSAINNVSNGDFIYLVGNSAQGQIPSFSMTTSSPQVVHGRFITRLAKNEGGKLIQIQYGDITVPPWSVDFASSALVAQTAESTEVADYASSAGYMGPFHVSNVGGNSVTVFDDTRTGNIGGCVVLGSVISSVSSASGLNLPNEYKLYLVGSSGINGYSFTYSSGSGVIIPGTNEFWTQLAYNNGGTIIQTQFGDIVQPQINISGSGSAEFPNWGQTYWHTSHLGSGLWHLYQAPVDGWLIANANIYKDPSSTGQTCVEVFFGGGPNDPYGRVNRVVLNKLHTMEDQYEMSIMNGQVIQVHSGCYFNILCTDGDATNPTYESSPDFSVTLDCYFCSNENFTL